MLGLIFAAAVAAQDACVAPMAPEVRETLYFGLSRRGGVVSEAQWRKFLKDEVTPRFPDGLTVVEGRGQWRGPAGVVVRERSKVLLVEHPETDTARRSIEALIAAYKKAFDQESVLWESEKVCAALK